MPNNKHRLIDHPFTLMLFQGVLFGIYAFCLVTFIRTGVKVFFTPDLPWLFASGDFIVQHQHLPTHDIFSWTHPDKPWVLYQWLFEVLLSIGRSAIGESNLIRLGIGLALFTYVVIPFWIHCQRGIRLFIATPILGLCLLTALLNISFRPMLFSVFFCLLLSWLIAKARRGEIKTSVLYPIIGMMGLVWGNIHTGISMGLLSILLYALGDWLELKQWYQFQPQSPELEGAPLTSRVYIKLFLALFLGSLINPYGFGIYTYLYWLSSQTYLNSIIMELKSPDFHLIQLWAFLLLFIGFIVTIFRSKKTLSASAALHLLVFGLMTMFVARFIVWSALYSALFLPIAMQHWIQSRGEKSAWETLTFSPEKYAFLIACILPAIALICLVVPAPILGLNITTGGCEAFSKGLRTYHNKLQEPQDIIFEDASIGSCRIYVDPHAKVFIDTRFDFYGSEFTQEMKETELARGDWEKTLAKRQINTLLLPSQLPLSKILNYVPAYKTIYHDSSMTIFRKI